MSALFFCSRRPLAALSRLLAAALLLGGCGAEPEDTSAAALRARFPGQADTVLSAPEAFAPAVDGFRLGATEPGVAWVRAARPEVVLPVEGSGAIRFRRAEGGEIRVRELGAAGEGMMAERAVSYRRAGGTSYWTATEGGVEEWLLLEEGVARGGEAVAAWQVEGAAVRERGEAVELVDEASGAAVLRVTAPRAYAASGRTVGLSLRARGSRIELSVDAGGEAVLVDPAWEPTGLMAEMRRDHTATLLPNGLVLLAGGWNGRDILDTAELYDPTTGEWLPAQPMTLARRDHTATLLRNGLVLVVGGSFGGFDTATAELYDPEADTWTDTGVMAFRRREHTATLLPSGLVLVAGGANAAAFHDSVELYDPALGTWSLTTSMLAQRLRHTATLLDSGQVLLVGGFGTTPATGAELYDPASNTWSLTSPVITARRYHTATRLQDGQVLVAGGSENDDDAQDVRSAELYDPATSAWSSTESMSMLAPHAHHAAVRLDNGRVLVTGGDNDAAAQVAELYDPAVGTWTATPPMKTTHQQHTATLLPSGQVLVAGPSRYAERYTGLGAECTLDADCALGVCVEGICCESRCDEPCHTCADIASPGECVPQPRGSDIRTECTDEGCDGACDGSGSCTAVPRGEACSPVECSDETHSMKSIACPADGARCPDPASPTREREDCGPYRCDRITGACKDQCASFQDCAPGFACDLTGRCAPPPPAASRGCSVVDGSFSDPPERRIGALLLALLALALRRLLAPRAARFQWSGWTLEREPEEHLMCPRCCFLARELSRFTRPLWALALLSGCSAEPEHAASAALVRQFPDHAAAVLSAREAFVDEEKGFRLSVAEEDGSASRLGVVLPRHGSEPIRFRTPAGLEVRVVELGAEGEGRMAERAVSYRRAGGTSFWTATDAGVEEWLLLDEGVARGDEPVAAWLVEGALLRARGAAVELVAEGSGAAVLRVTAPRAYAASGRPVALSLRVRGARIELSVDAAGEAVLVDPAWRLSGVMNVARTFHTATLLQNGKVLVVGGGGADPFTAKDSVELYDPETDEWTSTTSMLLHHARSRHTATLLKDGKVLVAGGIGSGGPTDSLASAELYDPETNAWTEARETMRSKRFMHTATLLESGKVLVAGGRSDAVGQDGDLASAELYDPEKGDWTSTSKDMTDRRVMHSATLLKDGKVLVAGGYSGSTLAGAELYDPAKDAWGHAAEMKNAHDSHVATLLESGVVLVTGGGDARGVTANAELYDPEKDEWTSTRMPGERIGHDAALLQGGKVLVLGGTSQTAPLASAELYDPERDEWIGMPPMAQARDGLTATGLVGGEILVAGGQSESLLLVAVTERYGLAVGEACGSSPGSGCLAGDFCVDGVCCDRPCPCGSCAGGHCSESASPAKVGTTCEPPRCDGETHSTGPGGACRRPSPVQRRRGSSVSPTAVIRRAAPANRSAPRSTTARRASFATCSAAASSPRRRRAPPAAAAPHRAVTLPRPRT
ncbi:kelch repeat-containing protein [Sorangium sp. So ce429]